MIVKQRSRFGCGIAVLAMLTGDEYDDIEQAARDQGWPGDVGLHRDWMNQYLFHAGFDLQDLAEPRHPDDQRPWPPEPFAPLHYALVQSADRKLHAVVVDADGSVRDPGTGTVRSLDVWPRLVRIVGLTL